MPGEPHCGRHQHQPVAHGLPAAAGLPAGTHWQWPVCFVVLIGWLQATSNTAAAADWPHWRGPARSGVVAESSGFTGSSWPGKPVWKSQVGEGSSSPLVAGNRLYTIGWRNGQDTTVCLDVTSGAAVWSHSAPAPRFGRRSNGDKGLYSAVCSTPEYDTETGLLYTLGIDGDLTCRDTRRKGARVWGFNLYERYDVPQRPRVGRSGQRDYGYVGSPLVTGDLLLVEVGAKTGNLIAFDRRTGAERWRSGNTDPPGHTGGPVLLEVDGVPCVAVHTFEGVVVTRLDGPRAGRTVGSFPWKTNFANTISTPAVSGSSLFVTSAYNQSRLARLEVTLKGIRLAWEQEGGSNVCSPVVFQGCVFSTTGRLRCHDAATGQLKWEGGRYQAPASIVATADGRLITWANRGDLTLIEGPQRSPDRYRELARVKGIFRTDVWPHLVLSGGRLFCRDRDGNLVCFAPGDARAAAAGKP